MSQEQNKLLGIFAEAMAKPSPEELPDTLHDGESPGTVSVPASILVGGLGYMTILVLAN